MEGGEGGGWEWDEVMEIDNLNFESCGDKTFI